MQTVKNITSLKYFLERGETVDHEYAFDVKYHKDAKSHFHSLPTFVAEFKNCSVHTLPLLLTEDRHMITDHVWPLLHKTKHKGKQHGLWNHWDEEIDIALPPITRQFDGTFQFVWLPIDETSAENPWHIWIDVISKFRLLEKRWSTNFAKYVYILPNRSKYFDKVVKELFPELKYEVMPKGEVWRFQHLLVPSMSNHDDGVTTPHLIPWLRHIKGRYEVPETRDRKIYIQRQGAVTRKVKNHNDLLLALKGWESVALEKLSIADQIKTFASASHILAPHGAGLVNLLWCRQGTKVIEMQDAKMVHKKVYPVLSHHLGLKHELYITDTVPITTQGKAKPKGVKRFNDLIDFNVNIPDLIRHLD